MSPCLPKSISEQKNRLYSKGISSQLRSVFKSCIYTKYRVFYKITRFSLILGNGRVLLMNDETIKWKFDGVRFLSDNTLEFFKESNGDKLLMEFDDLPQFIIELNLIHLRVYFDKLDKIEAN